MIEAKNLIKNFDGVQALDDVSFHVEKGEILGFLGPNGAGKTTTMRILTCYFPPSGGTATVAGFDVLDQSLEVRKRVGYLPETVPVYQDMPVDAYLDFVASVKGIPGRDRKKRIEEVMADCDLTDVRERAVGKLSKGYRQRVGLAQAIVGNPQVLILDEPTVGLDPKQIIEIRNLIKRLADKATIILSTHILQEVSAICNRVIIINKGKIVAIDTPENLTSQLERVSRVSMEIEGPPSEVQVALKEVPGVVKVEKLQQVEGTANRFEYQVHCEKGKDVRKDLAQKVVRADWGLTLLRHMDLSLEEIFIQMVTEDRAQPPAEPITDGKPTARKSKAAAKA